MGKFSLKNQNCQFLQKSGMQNLMMTFNFSVFDWIFLLCTNLVQKIKIVRLNTNSVPRLIWICRIQWGCSLFLILILNIFFGLICSRNSKLFVQSEIRDIGVRTLISNTIDISGRWYKLTFAFARPA